MDAKLIYRRRVTRRTLENQEIRIVMDLYEIPEPERAKYPEGFRFSWIAFDVENPEQRVLFDCHPPKGPHFHVNNEPEIQIQWVSLEKTEALFFEKVQASLGNFISEDEEED